MIGARIREFRKERKLTQDELAAEVGVGQGVVSKWECHKMRPDFESLDALALVFGTTIDAFTAGTDMSKAEREKERQKKSETAARAVSYTPSTNPTIPGTTDDAGFSVAFRLAVSSAGLPSDLEELSGALLSSVQQLGVIGKQLDDVGVLLAKLGAVVDSARISGHGARQPSGLRDSGEPHETPDGGSLPPPSRRQA